MYQERFWKDAEDTLVLAVERYQREGKIDSMIDLLSDCLMCEKAGSKSKLDIFYERVGAEAPDDIGYLAYSDFSFCLFFSSKSPTSFSHGIENNERRAFPLIR